MLAIGAVPATASAGATFTWDPAAVAPPGEAGPEFTADTMYGGHYLWGHGPNAPPTVAVPGLIYPVNFIEQIQQFSLGGGAPFVPTGLNGTPGAPDSYGLYLTMSAQVEQVGSPNIFKYDSMTMSLWLDPGNNDGALSSTVSGVGFANGTAGDIMLATGTLVSGHYTLNPAPGIRSIGRFKQTFLAAPGESGFFVPRVSPGTFIQEILTTPCTVPQDPSKCALINYPDLSNPKLQFSVLNGGTAKIDLQVPEPASVVLLASALGLLVVARRRRT